MKLLPLAAGAVALAAAGFMAPAEARIYVGIDVPLVVTAPPAPPPAVVETAPRAPAPGYVWIPGRQVWNGGGYVWVRGHWSHPPRAGVVWIPAGWHRGPGGGWFWRPGHWR